jgi:ribonuclease Y
VGLLLRRTTSAARGGAEPTRPVEVQPTAAERAAEDEAAEAEQAGPSPEPVAAPVPVDETAAARADALMASVTAAQVELEEQMQARRAELRSQRADVERRESRLTEREERLDTEARALDDRAKSLDGAAAELTVQRKALADVETQHLHTLERVAGLTAEQAKVELVAAVEHDA